VTFNFKLCTISDTFFCHQIRSLQTANNYCTSSSLDDVFVRALSLTFCADDCTVRLLTSSCVLFLTNFLRCLSRSLHTATNYCTSSSASKKYPGDTFLTRGIAESYPPVCFISSPGYYLPTQNHPPGRSRSYTGLIGFNPRRLQGPKRG